MNHSGVVRLCETSFEAGGAPVLCTSENLAPDAAADTSIRFAIAYGSYDSFSPIATFAPPDAVIYPGGTQPLGAIVGRLRSSTTLGLVNQPCFPGLSDTYMLRLDFTLLNASTDPTMTLKTLDLGQAGEEGALEPLRDDINLNGLPDLVDLYPDFLNKLFDPDRVGDINGDLDEEDIDGFSGPGEDDDGPISEANGEAALDLDANGDGDKTDAVDLDGNTVIAGSVAENGPLNPLRPLARYAGSTIVAGTAYTLNIVVFEHGQLADFPDPHPFSDYDGALGYPILTILNDPNQALAPSAITDYCTPFASTTVLLGTTRDNPCTAGGEGSAVQCLNDNTDCWSGSCGYNHPINHPTVCTNTVDDDGDGWVNEGCPNIMLPEMGGDCNDAEDDDGDLIVNDGCTAANGDGTGELDAAGVVEGHKTAGGEAGAVRAQNPPAGTGIDGSGTHIYTSMTQSYRDFDNDGYENSFDTCPYDDNTDDGRVTYGTDWDMIDPICDPTPAINTNLGNHDLDSSGVPPLSWLNSLDNCPQNPNDNQRETDWNLPRTLSSPNGGNQMGDNIGDACEGSETAAQCQNAIDDDSDGVTNDGCPQIGFLSESDGSFTGGPNCANAVDDDAADDALEVGGPGATVNDGCPTVDAAGLNLRSSGHFHMSVDFTAKCIGGTDHDGDGYCDALETTLGSATAGAASAGESSQTAQAVGTDWDQGGAETVAGVNQCDDNTDDDGDGFVNDGCPANGGAEFAQMCAPGDATDDDLDGDVNDGCFTVGRGNCEDGQDNDGDTFTDSADEGCSTPEHYSLEFPLPLANRGAGPDADNDTVPDNDGGGPANDDAITTQPGQREEPHQVCSDDIDQDRDGDIDAHIASNDPSEASPSATPDSGCGTAAPFCPTGNPANDADADGFCDGDDNCASAYNPNQMDTDADGQGDACDTDDDGDGMTDAEEWECGYLALDGASTGGPPCTYDITVIDLTGGPTNTNPDYWDQDGDGYTWATEDVLGTDPYYPCGGDGWPGDLPDPFNPGGDNRSNIMDLNSFMNPQGAGPRFNVFGEDVSGNALSPATASVGRWDLSSAGDSKINIADLNALFNSYPGGTAFPAMFGYERAFANPLFGFSGTCPFPP